ncbi:MAG: Piwi domain-containing protein [Bacteroidia bacterium]
MLVLDPHLIFQNPENYLDFITKSPEGQYFDRKEVRDDIKKGKENLKKTISAFTNSRGGILILGISDDGNIVGLNHLTENELNALVQEKIHLINHQAQSKEFYIEEKRLLAVYAPEGLSGVCKTNESHPKAWIREAAQNQPLSPQQEEALLLERNKKWEQLSVCEVSPVLINKGVLEIFKKRYLEEQGAAFSYEDTEFLLNIGAAKPENSRFFFTYAGFLFFANNPSAHIPGAQIRFLKYESPIEQYKQAGNPTFDKTFDGCLPELLRKVRTFVNEGAFFKKYTYRNPYESGIVEEPELPPNAVEESIVNALIHRDYHSPLPIECILYKDAFAVRSPGRILQDGVIPANFSLDDQQLSHYPRNPKISQWAKTMVDESGQRFVKSLSEGHRTMLKAMKELKLPAPRYSTNGFTTVKLFNDSVNREARIRQLQQPLSDEFTNLFPIEFQYHTLQEPDPLSYSIQIQLLHLIRDKLRNLGWYIDKEKKSRITVHQRGKNLKINALIDAVLHVYPAYDLQVYVFDGKFYLSVDYTIQVRNISSLDKLLQKKINFQERFSQVKYGGTWTAGLIESYTTFTAKVRLPEYETTEEVACENIIPNLSKTELSAIASTLKFDLEAKIKEFSMASLANASKDRATKILDVAKFLATQVFPMGYNGFTAHLSDRPLTLQLPDVDENLFFTLFRNLKEPEAKFQENHTEANILSGLTRFGALITTPRDIEIVPFCLTGFENSCQQLIETLQRGQMNFKGMERTFGTSLTFTSVISKSDAHDFLPEIQRLLTQHPHWIGNPDLTRIFLIHIPEDRYPATDIHSPYFILKEYLLEKGIPVQMVDTNTLLNPKFKDLNLALNINAKTGGTPWVLPNALPEADCFIGLSYAQYREDNHFRRTMGYANVFDRYGQWMFYKGNSLSFDFEEKHIHLAKLVKESLLQRKDLSDSASIHIHYTNKFSRLDREHILAAVKSVRPKATVSFVWINLFHNIRMFDNRIEGNGSLSRGSYVVTGKHQIYLSTTGYSTLKKTLGTPVLLEVNTLTEPYNPQHIMPYRSIAQHILALTKLNWSSTQSINALPVTLKYAHEIARLTSVFYQRTGTFKLHPVLERTPWFI